METTRNQQEWETEFLNKVCKKLSRVIPEVKTLYPYSTKGGFYDNVEKPPYSWTCGFWGGILWWMYRFTGEKEYFERAKMASRRMDAGLTEFLPLGHDVGFQYLLTTVADYITTKSERARKSSIHAATLLAGRYNVVGKYIRAWNEGTGVDLNQSKAGYVIIDCMMNLPLLYWASEETGDPRFKQIAMSHADTVMREFIKQDGSTCHIVVFDPETGKVVDKPKGQGYAPNSSWSRGQGWEIYGFAMSYVYTNKKEYLETALKAVRYFMKNMDRRDVPPLDFEQPENPELFDTSAGVIAVCGMIELQKWVDDECREELEQYIRILLKGAYKNCDFSDDEQSILQNCSELYHSPEHHIPLIYGDFYLLEALMKRRNEKMLFER